MNFVIEKKTIITLTKNRLNNFIVTHVENLPTLYKKKIIELSIEGIYKAFDFLDITHYVAKKMNEFDNSDKWQCICGYRDSFNITGPEEMGIAFNIGNFKFVVFK